MPKLTPNTGTFVPAKRRKRMQDRPVAAEDEAEVGRLAGLLQFDPGRLRAVLVELGLVGDQPPARLACAAAAAIGTASVAAGGCEWVISAAVLMPAPGPRLAPSTSSERRLAASAAATADSRSSSPGPSPPHQTKVSRLPFGPGSPEEAMPRTGSPISSAARATFSTASCRSPASRTTPRPTRPSPARTAASPSPAARRPAPGRWRPRARSWSGR